MFQEPFSGMKLISGMHVAVVWICLNMMSRRRRKSLSALFTFPMGNILFYGFF